jgi:uncharacterized surface protein with fasciclin (FAS1) repeats
MGETKSIVQTAIEMGDFTTLVNAAKKLGLDEKFDSDGPYTIFAPIEKAFESIPDSVIEEAFDDPDYLMDIINYHIVEGKYLVSDLLEAGSLTALNGKTLEITKDSNTKVNGNPIEKEDIECSNGVIHTIADILIP